MNPLDALSCILPAVGIWIVIFRAPTVPHLLEMFVTKTPMTGEDVELYLLGNYPNLLLLYLCVWCQAFWTSALAGLGAVLFYDVRWFWMPVYIMAFYPITTIILWTTTNLERSKPH